MDQRRAETSGLLRRRGDASSLLARQPWARVAKELALYAWRLGPAREGSASRVQQIARAAMERACGPGAPAWNPLETNLWTVLTGIVDELLAKEATPDSALPSRGAERERIPLLDNEALDAALRAGGLDPEVLGRDGAAIRSELAARGAAPAASSALARRRPELPAVSRTGWLALAGVVLATVLVVLLAILWVRRS